MPRIAARIKKDDLRERIEAQMDSTDGDSHLPFISEQIRKDLSKVSFDMENFEWNDGVNLGYQQLPGGLTCLMMHAGGDWEWPIYLLIYYDGKKLRGYIPKDGNPWNTDTKQAFGNDEKADEKNMKKRYDVDCVTSLHSNWELMVKDIEKRIVIK